MSGNPNNRFGGFPTAARLQQFGINWGGQIISPNCNFRTNNYYNPTGEITKITPHHTAGIGSAAGIASIFSSTSRGASCNYAIGNDGQVYGVVPETYRAWTSSSPENDFKAITFEVSNSVTGGDWLISPAAYDSLVRLSAEICNNYGITPNFDGTPNGSITVHRMFAGTACPGPYLYSLISTKPTTGYTEYKFQADIKSIMASQGGSVPKPSSPSEQDKINNTVKDQTKLIYNTLEDVPEWAKESIQRLYNRDILQGNEDGKFALSYDMLRTLAWIDRAMNQTL